MTTLAITSTAPLRAISPHRQKLLSSVSRRDSSPHQMLQHKQTVQVFSNAQTLALLRTSCCCEGPEPQPSNYNQMSTPQKNQTVQQRKGMGRGRGPQQVTVSKALQQVHLSSWAKGSISNFFGGFHAFSLFTPTKLADEFNRIISKVGIKRGKERIADAENQRMYDDEVSLRETVEAKSRRSRTPVLTELSDTDREQHTFEKAMEDTNHSITSYFHAYTQSQYTPPVQAKVQVQPALKALPPPPPPPPPAPAPAPVKPIAKAAEDEVSWSIFRQIPLPFLMSDTKPAKKKGLVRKDFVSRSAIEARTRAIVASIKTASSFESKISRVKDLCKHIKQYPSGRLEATECKVVPLLLPLTQSDVKDLREEAMEALCLLGYIPPVKGRGIRVLTLDGGGTRGLMMIHCMRKLEQMSNRRIYELFDYVGGVSTGALIACMVCLYRVPLDHCEKLYLDFSKKMFSRSRFIGTGGLVWNHAFYDSDQWEKILQTEIGSKTLIEFSRDPLCPKMSALSTVMNTPRMKNFVFRNYNLPPNSFSAHPGNCTHMVWEVVRASSAAPGYYEDFLSGEYVHSDGGLSVNNPTALAIHESRLLWPNEEIQCVVSLGTGRYEPIAQLANSNKVSLKEKVSKIVDSATDTEAVHIMMNDLMPPSTYFRFNPYLSEDLQLDEIRQEKIDCMLRDTGMYLRKNEVKMAKAASVLKQGRMPHQIAMDWVKYKVDCNI